MKFIYKIIFALCLFIGYFSTSQAQISAPPMISSEADIMNISTYTGVIAERYADGSPSLRKTVVNGKAEGLWLEWYPDGTLRYRAYWKNGLGNGKWEYFYPNGQLRSESFYIDDIGQGIYKYYYENGQIQTDAVYLNGKLDGIKLTYDATGIIIDRQKYDNGELIIDEPIIFSEGNISSKESNEWGIDFTPDGKTAYFTRRDAATNEKRIYISQKGKNDWSKPTIAPFSTGEDEAAYITRTGDKIFFASFRPLPDGSTTRKYDMNIWYAEKTKEGWSDPQPISSNINKSMRMREEWPTNYEAGPFTDKAGNLYFWTKGTKSKATNLYFAPLKSNGAFGKSVELIELSSDKNYDTEPYLSLDEDIIFFASDDRSDSYGGSDIYYSKKINSQWSKPKNLGPIVNSSGNEGFPSLSPDGRYFFFSSTRAKNKDANGESLSDIYYLEAKFLMIK